MGGEARGGRGRTGSANYEGRHVPGFGADALPDVVNCGDGEDDGVGEGGCAVGLVLVEWVVVGHGW